MTDPSLSLLLTAGGGYYSGGPEAAEQWVVGVRLAIVHGLVSDVGSFPTNIPPNPVSINRTETDWTITGNWQIQSGPDTFAPDDYLNDQAAPAFATWMGAGPIGSQTIMNWMKLALISSPLGHEEPAPPYLKGSPILLTWTGSNPTGGAGSSGLPLQVAFVVGHRTPQLGARGRGRMFLPGLSESALTGSGARWTSSIQTTAAAAQKTLLNALVKSPVGAADFHVRPCVTGKPFTDYACINAVRVGDVPDTQQRRKKSLKPVYVTESL